MRVFSLSIFCALVLASALSCTAEKAKPAELKKCKKLLWFTAVAGPNKEVKDYQSMLRAALLSARDRAPSLIPHLIYERAPDNFTKWWEKEGGVVHANHHLSFLADIKSHIQRQPEGERRDSEDRRLSQYGAYLRMDIPSIMQTGVKVKKEEVETAFILYTDADVLFLKDIDTCVAPPAPAVMYMGGEFQRNTIANSGVLFLNVTRLRNDLAALVKYGREHGWPGLYDQTIFLSFYSGSLSQLPDEFNWKPYYGPSKKAFIIHFHGPKPGRCMECLVMAAIDERDMNACNCPPVYITLWNMSPDKGRSFAYNLLRWYYYAAKAFDVLPKKALL